MTTVWTKGTHSQEVADELKNEISGKTVLITGATIGGLGGEAAYDIAKYAKLLIIVGPNADRLQKSKDKILGDHKNVKVRQVVADLTSWKSVRKAADEIVAIGEPINVVILNAVVQADEYIVTEDGYEKQLSADHFAHFVLTARIFPLILSARSKLFPPRVVVITSDAHAIGSINFDGDLTFSDGKEYDPIVAYGRAKVANMLFARELAKRAASKGVLAFAVHPGAIWTNLWDRITHENKIKLHILNPDGSVNRKMEKKQLDQGATSYIVAAFDPRIKDQSGSYITEDGQIHNEKISEFSASSENAARLWELSEKLTGEKFIV